MFCSSNCASLSVGSLLPVFLSVRLGISLQASLFQIIGYRGLVAEVEKLRREPYDCENTDHEDMLLKVRKAMGPGDRLKSNLNRHMLGPKTNILY